LKYREKNIPGKRIPGIKKYYPMNKCSRDNKTSQGQISLGRKQVEKNPRDKYPWKKKQGQISLGKNGKKIPGTNVPGKNNIPGTNVSGEKKTGTISLGKKTLRDKYPWKKN